MNKQALGHWGEQQAAEFLTARDYEILAHNVRTPYGEIDLIANHGDVLIFVEVKTRRSTHFGNPEEAVTAEKQTHLLEACQHYLQEHPDLQGDWRIDVIAIQVRRGDAAPEIVHFENAVS